MSNVHVIPEYLWREQKRRFRSFDSQPPNFITAAQLVDVLKSADGAVYELSTQRPLWNTKEQPVSYVLLEEPA